MKQFVQFGTTFLYTSLIYENRSFTKLKSGLLLNEWLFNLVFNFLSFVQKSTVNQKNNFSEQFLLKLTTGIKKRSDDFKKRMFVSQFQTLTLKKSKLMVSSLYSS